MFIIASPPSPVGYSAIVGFSLFATVAILIGWMLWTSWRAFRTNPETDAERPLDLELAGRVLTSGSISSNTFCLVAALHFTIAMAAVLCLPQWSFLDRANSPPNVNGLAAYTEPPRSHQEFLLAHIKACGWNDRFLRSYLEDNWNAKTQMDELSDDPIVSEYLQFRKTVAEEFAKQAPDAAKNLAESLKPVFLIIAGLFVATTRAMFQSHAGSEPYRLASLISSGLLAFTLSQLGYYVVVAYHWDVDLNAALSAGRIVCNGHYAGFFRAQVVALTLAALVQVGLLILSPGRIFRSI